MELLTDLLALVIRGLYFAIFIKAIISWFPIDQNGAVVRALNQITEPIIEPIRKILPTFGMLDLAPLVAILLLSFLSRMLESASF